ncbi:MAG: aerotolerance regulator BatA [Verrucomicrobia bacterium]|nr:aerotolerance regulator BatA [Verrucomicrobiota bacterium]
MFRFGDPLYFLLLLPAAAGLWFIYRRRVRTGLAFAAAYRVPASGTTWRVVIAGVLPAIFLAGVFLAIAALARPQTVFSKTRRTSDVIAIEMVVDCSGSMNALDLSEQTPSGTRWRTRLDVVKEAFADFVSRRPDDLMGLVTFGGFATSRAPLTLDHEALLKVLQGVQIVGGTDATREEQLTAIGDALATACGRMEKADPKSRIIVLLSDGDSNTGIIEPDQAAKIAKQMGIKVYTIGVGSNGQVPVKVRDPFGRDVIARAEFPLDEEQLRRIASTTGGKYFNVRDARGMERVLGDISKLEKTRVERAVYNQYNELFPWFLTPGLAMIVIGSGLNMLVVRRIL